jgi:hypothetical protein
MCSREPVLLWVGCGNSETMEMLENPALFETQPIFWQCFVGSDVPLLKRFFARADPKPLEQKLNTILADLLSSDPNIHIVECP